MVMDSHYKTRAEAKAHNAKLYFTGKACVNGHVCERNVSDGHCLDCNRVRDKERYPDRREKILDYSRKYRKEHLEEHRAYDRARNKQPERHKSRMVANRLREKLIRQSMVYPHERKAIIELYKNRPEGSHVHHVIPLQGETVCGLTSLNNLTYLDAEENMRLGNKFIADDWSQ